MSTRARAIKVKQQLVGTIAPPFQGATPRKSSPTTPKKNATKKNQPPFNLTHVRCRPMKRPRNPEKIRVRLPFWLTSDYPRHKKDYRSSRARSSAVAFQLIFLGSPSSSPTIMGKGATVHFILPLYLHSLPPSSHIRFCWPCIVGSFDGCYP